MIFNPESALKHRVIMLAGEEEALRRRALDDLLAKAGIQKDDFELETLSADASNPMEWYASVSTAPFMGDRRTAIIRHLLRIDADKLKGVDFAKLPASSLLILIADDEAGGEDRQRTLKSSRLKWEKAVTKAGGASYSFDPDPKGALLAIKQEVARIGKKISDPAAAALVEMTGGSLSRGIDELKKVEMFLGNQEMIRESDIREVVVASREWNVYRMVDSVFNGQTPEALRQLRVLIGSQTKAEEAAFQRILPTVSRHLRLLWQARICVEAGCNPTNPPESVAKMLPSKNSITAEQSYRLGALMGMARVVSLPAIERCFAIVADTDARLKGSLSSFSALDTLERMLLEMSAAVTPAAAPSRGR